jgi:predicted esterase
MTALLASATFAATLVAAPAGVPPVGQLVEGLRCESDPSQSYTLYLPRAYSPARRSPALLVFDPRGRSVLAAELFREAAEAHGWIILSSNDTRSDGPMEANAKALAALWPEVHLRYASDPRRIYAAGFSGGGMLAYELGRRTGRLAGVIASGARWDEPHFKQRIAFPCFGAAGDTDFNYSPMKAVHARLREWRTPEWLLIFEGRHQWMPAELASQAITWMELNAIRSGLRPADPAFVASQLAQELGRARALETEGHPLAAQQRFESAAATFDGLADLAEARREAARVAALAATKSARREEQRLDRYEEVMGRRLAEAYHTLMTSELPPLAAAFRAEVPIDEIRRRAAAAGYEGVVGRRLLDTLATQTGFYMAREFLARKDHVRALAALSVATEAAPGRPAYWYNLACVQARLGGRRQALDALERAVRAGYSDREGMAADEDLASLREEERFKALVRPPAP